MQHQQPQTSPNAATGNSHQALYTPEAMFSPLIDGVAQKAALSGGAK